MEDLCTACLCSGRILFKIEGTEIQELYVQIISEISISEGTMSICVRVCWECKALLYRFMKFKKQTQRSYRKLLDYNASNVKPELEKLPRLQIHSVHSSGYPELEEEVKLEYDGLDIKEELSDRETHYEPENFAYDLVTTKKKSKQKVKLKKKKLKDGLDIKEELSDRETHYEPENFAYDLVVEDVGGKKKKEENKKTTKKKSKQKVKLKKKKLKVKSVSKESDLKTECLESEIKNYSESVISDKFKCDECSAVFGDQAELKQHVEVEHTVPVQEPVLNGSVPRSREQLPERPQCVECGKIFSSRKTYRYHLNVLHKGQNRYPCPRCGKVYQWKSNLGRHMRSHKARDSGELHCHTCDKRFASVATYRQHLRVSRRHVAETDFTFMCNECGKKFVNKTRLRDHIDWEHLHKIKFRCQLCDKPFKCHTSLYVHMQNVHRNKEKKDNLCHVCGKSYQNAAKLKYHIVAMHTSETPYSCEQCSAAFGWYSSLYRHVREVHYKMKIQPKKTKKAKKGAEVPSVPPDC